MTIVAADSNRQALLEMERCLKSVFRGGDVVTFFDALSTYKYCVNHAEEISAVFLPVVLKPMDGFKLRELLLTLETPVNVVFVLREKSDELQELMMVNGVIWHIVKPVTVQKVAAAAEAMVANCWADEGDCRDCALFWCEKWRGR